MQDGQSTGILSLNPNIDSMVFTLWFWITPSIFNFFTFWKMLKKAYEMGYLMLLLIKTETKERLRKLIFQNILNFLIYSLLTSIFKLKNILHVELNYIMLKSMKIAFYNIFWNKKILKFDGVMSIFSGGYCDILSVKLTFLLIY